MQSEATSSIDELGYFASSTYKAKSRQDKMEDLWRMLVPDENDHSVVPRAYYWKEFDHFFTTNANRAFCRDDDEIRIR